MKSNIKTDDGLDVDRTEGRSAGTDLSGKKTIKANIYYGNSDWSIEIWCDGGLYSKSAPENSHDIYRTRMIPFFVVELSGKFY